MTKRKKLGKIPETQRQMSADAKIKQKYKTKHTPAFWNKKKK